MINLVPVIIQLATLSVCFAEEIPEQFRRFPKPAQFSILTSDGFQRIEGSLLKVQFGQNITLRCDCDNLAKSQSRSRIGRYTNDGQINFPLMDCGFVDFQFMCLSRDRHKKLESRVTQFFDPDRPTSVSLINLIDIQPYDLNQFVCNISGQYGGGPPHNITLVSDAEVLIGVRAGKILNITNGPPIGYTCSVYRTEGLRTSHYRVSFCVVERNESASGKVANLEAGCINQSTYATSGRMQVTQGFGAIVAKEQERVKIDRFSLTNWSLRDEPLDGKSIFEATLIRESFELTPFDGLEPTPNTLVSCSVVEDGTDVTYGDFVTIGESANELKGMPFSQKPNIDLDLDSMLTCGDQQLVGEPGSYVTFLCGITQPEYNGSVSFEWEHLDANTYKVVTRSVASDSNFKRWYPLDVEALKDNIKLDAGDDEIPINGKRPWMKYRTKLSVLVNDVTVGWRFRLVSNYSDGSLQRTKEFRLVAAKKPDPVTSPSAEKQKVEPLVQDAPVEQTDGENTTVQQDEVTEQEPISAANLSVHLQTAALSGASVLTVWTTMPLLLAAIANFLAGNF